MHTTEIARLRAEANRLERLDAKVTPQIEATILAEAKNGYKPAEIARVLKLDRKTVSEVLRLTNRKKNKQSPKPTQLTNNNYIEEHEKNHQGIGRKCSLTKAGKIRHDKLKKCPACSNHFITPALTYPRTSDGQRAYNAEIKAYNDDTHFRNIDGKLVYPIYEKQQVSKLSTARPTIPTTPNIATIPSNMTEQQQNFVALQLEAQKQTEELAKTTPQKENSSWTERIFKTQKNRKNKLQKQRTKALHADIINKDRLAKIEAELNSLENKED